VVPRSPKARDRGHPAGRNLAGASATGEKEWVKLAGGLKHLHKETARINEIMEREFEEIELEGCE
jgi:hypothetical protein